MLIVYELVHDIIDERVAERGNTPEFPLLIVTRTGGLLLKLVSPMDKRVVPKKSWIRQSPNRHAAERS
jgi:hypothetical protein